MLNNLIVYGGTFDPIHMGHINTALAVQAHFHFDCFRFLPCKIPLLKDKAHATTEQRVTMLKLALADLPPAQRFEIDSSEINRESPSYMVTTLLQLREKLGNELPITLLLGQDTFYQLPAWHQWQRLLELSNLLVIKRPNPTLPLPSELQSLLRNHETQDEGLILTQPAGLILQFNAGLYPISSTQIRKELQRGLAINQDTLPASVMNYIALHHLYQ